MRSIIPTNIYIVNEHNYKFFTLVIHKRVGFTDNIQRDIYLGVFRFINIGFTTYLLHVCIKDVNDSVT